MRCVFTLASGLDPHERNLREDVTAAYIGVPAEEIRTDLDLEAVGKGANVLLMTPPEPDNTEAGGVFYHPRKLMNGLTGVNPTSYTWISCCTAVAVRSKPISLSSTHWGSVNDARCHRNCYLQVSRAKAQ
jgi:hypothetical protein